jgi:UDPglucose--hexose-1-phosphate uridylyltransferase
MVAPARARRPGALLAAPPDDGVEECPFCEGNERETPPEVLAVAPAGREADSPGWRVRVVPNKFPAFSAAAGRQEIVVHCPCHRRSLAELGTKELHDVADAWRRRADSARSEGFRYLHAFVNEGRAAGASRAHSHSQLVWLPDVPPAVAHELERSQGGCVVCSLLERELADGSRVVANEGGMVVLCPYASRAPYELLVAPRHCEADAFQSELLGVALDSTAAAVRSLHGLEGPVPLNAWLHTSPFDEASGHWHVEVLPRLTILAGLELGSELYVNPLPPERAAAALRQ